MKNWPEVVRLGRALLHIFDLFMLLLLLLFLNCHVLLSLLLHYFSLFCLTSHSHSHNQREREAKTRKYGKGKKQWRDDMEMSGHNGMEIYWNFWREINSACSESIPFWLFFFFFFYEPILTTWALLFLPKPTWLRVGLKPNLYLFTFSSSFVLFLVVVVAATAAFVCNSLEGDLNLLEIAGAISWTLNNKKCIHINLSKFWVKF